MRRLPQALGGRTPTAKTGSGNAVAAALGLDLDKLTVRVSRLRALSAGVLIRGAEDGDQAGRRKRRDREFVEVCQVGGGANGTLLLGRLPIHSWVNGKRACSASKTSPWLCATHPTLRSTTTPCSHYS